MDCDRFTNNKENVNYSFFVHKMEKVYNVKPKQGSSMLLAGPSKPGENKFASNLVAYKHNMFDIIPQRVIWILTTKKADDGDVLYTSDLKIIPYFYDLVIIDDMMMESENSTEVRNMFTKIAYCTPCFVVFIIQILLQRGKHARTCSLNAHCIILF